MLACRAQCLRSSDSYERAHSHTPPVVALAVWTLRGTRCHRSSRRSCSAMEKRLTKTTQNRFTRPIDRSTDRPLFSLVGSMAHPRAAAARCRRVMLDLPSSLIVLEGCMLPSKARPAHHHHHRGQKHGHSSRRLSVVGGGFWSECVVIIAGIGRIGFRTFVQSGCRRARTKTRRSMSNSA